MPQVDSVSHRFSAEVGRDGRICALVITRDRLPLLQKCIAIIRLQARPPDEIVVVNNGSSDGTLAWLREQPDITALDQENSGVAGGVYSGLKYSYDRGYAWTWINDDDAFPALDALEQLLIAASHKPEGRLFNSLSIDKDDSSRICFHYICYRHGDQNQKKRYDYVYDLLQENNTTLVVGEAQLYCSSLVHRDIVSGVGLPLPDLFIRGDEAEYLQRMLAHGFTTYTVTNSRVFHAQQRLERLRILGKDVYYEPMNKLKRYYTARNAVWGDRHFPGAWGPASTRWLRVVKIFAYHQILASATTRGLAERLSSSIAIFRAIVDGLRMDRNARIAGRPTIYREPVVIQRNRTNAGQAWG